jgi:hypothetical protein
VCIPVFVSHSIEPEKRSVSCFAPGVTEREDKRKESNTRLLHMDELFEVKMLQGGHEWMDGDGFFAEIAAKRDKRRKIKKHFVISNTLLILAPIVLFLLDRARVIGQRVIH